MAPLLNDHNAHVHIGGQPATQHKLRAPATGGSPWAGHRTGSRGH